MPNLASNVAVGAPEVAPVDSGRVQTTTPNFGGLLATAIGGAGMARKFIGEQALGGLLDKNLTAGLTGDYGSGNSPDAYAPGIPGAGGVAGPQAPGSAVPTMGSPAGPVAAAGAASNAAADRTGIPTDPAATAALVDLSQKQSALDQMAVQNVRNQSAKEIFQDSNLRSFIRQYPWMAREAMQVTGMASQFTDKLYNIQHGAQEAYVAGQIQQGTALQKASIEGGSDELAHMSPLQVMDNYQNTKWWKDYSAAKQSDTLLQGANNKYNLGVVTDKQTMFDWMNKAGPGMFQQYTGARNQIMNDSTLSAADKTAKLMLLPGQMHDYVRSIAPPNLTDDDINAHVGYMAERAKIDVEIANGGTKATAAQNQYNAMDAAQKFDFARSNPTYLAWSKMNELWHQVPVSFASKSGGINYANGFAQYAGSWINAQQGKPGYDPAANAPAGTPTAQAAADTGAAAAALVSAHADPAAWDGLTDNAKGAIATHSIDMLRSSANTQTDAGLDKFLATTAEPGFANVADRPEFKDRWSASDARTLGRYNYNMTAGLIQAYPELGAASMQLTRDKDGIYQIQPDAKATPSHKAAIAQYNVRMGNSIRTAMNIQGYTTDQANQWFVQTGMGAVAQ